MGKEEIEAKETEVALYKNETENVVKRVSSEEAEIEYDRKKAYHDYDKGIGDGTEELSLEDFQRILGKTVYEDPITTSIMFLITLLTYTDSEQKNMMITGESSLGKTFTTSEVLWFFPKEDVKKFHGATPKSIIHKNGVLIDLRTNQPIDLSLKPQKGDPKPMWDAWYEMMRNSGFLLDFSRKIIVFPDQPDTRLLKSLRSIMSHDDRDCRYSITDKSSKGTFRTKEVVIKGFFTSIFATTSTKIDEQEATRHFLLTPSDALKKIQKAMELIAKKNSDPVFARWYRTDSERVGLQIRILLLKAEYVNKIFIPSELMEELKDWFMKKIHFLAPKTQRDFPRLIALAKAWALLNWKQRKNDDHLWCNKTDIEVAKALYLPILTCAELGLTPEEYSIFQMIESEYVGAGLPIKEIHTIYYKNKKRSCSDTRLRGILKNFCRAGLMREEKEGKKYLYHVTDSSEETSKTPDKLEFHEDVPDDTCAFCLKPCSLDGSTFYKTKICHIDCLNKFEQIEQYFSETEGER